MNKLSEFFKGLIEKWKEASKKKKVAFSVIFLGVIVALGVLTFSLGSTKYEVLFSNMDPNDSAAVYAKLQEKKIVAKVSGNSILVPKDKVEQLRMEIISAVPMTSGSQGFELLDKSKFGSTDAEIKINYQRALQGELERTIKSFPQVTGARVHLVLPEDTTFIKDTAPARASVTVSMKQGQKLNQDQVKAVVSLISGSVKNLPKENVELVDDKMTLLTKDLELGNNKNGEAMTPVEKQQELKNKYEKDAEKKLLATLEALLGKDKVKVNVNADLDFDAVQQESTAYETKSVVVSEHIVTDGIGGAAGANTSSPVDNNMGNKINNGTAANGNSTHQDITKNYDVPETKQKTIKAPGSLRRQTISVAVDGNLDDQTKNAIRNLAVTAIGFEEKRGDSVTVEGMQFDKSAQEAAKKDLDAMKQAEALQKKQKLYTMIGAAVLALALIIGTVILIKRKKSDELLEDRVNPHGIDVIIGDEATTVMPTFKALDLDMENEKSHLEKEIKRYAKDKPEQVADIIKSWIAEDER